MSDQREDINDGPPFFSNWKGLYVFVLLFELVLIFLFIAITNYFGI